ncbi:MAG: hypothetical protein F4X65_09925 [Chloroflexi bacterium]|nr:hypothetical protein [Chloroflexota bacterium]
MASATADGPAAGPAGDSPRSERRAQARADAQSREEGGEDASLVAQESAQDTAVETARVAMGTAPAGGDATQEDAVSLASSRSESRPTVGRGGTAGVVQQWEGDRLTVTSPQGQVVVALSDTTTIYLVGETDRESLAAGANVRVTGARDAEGVVNAQAVIIVPEGADNLFGVGRQSGRQGRGRP